MSLWFKYESGSFKSQAQNGGSGGGSQSFMLRCEKAEKAKGNTIEVVMKRDSRDGISMRASFLNQKWVAEIAEVNKKIDISGWNLMEIHIDGQSNLRIAINSVQQASIYLGNQNELSDIQKYSSDCWLGGGDVVGLSLRHLIFATGLSIQISDYSDQYAHSTPAPLDPYVLGYYALEDSDDISQSFQSQQFINITSWNEPDPICHCVGSEDAETANYPHLGNSADRAFDAIPSLTFPKPENFSVKVSFQFSMILISTSKGYNHEIISHNGLWSLGSYSDQQLYAFITGVNETVKFDVSNDQRFARRQILFKNQWMNYTFGFNQTTSYLIVDDLSQKTPLTLTYQFQNPIDLTAFQNQKQGQFVIRPQSVSGLFSGISYSVSEVELFNFKFSQDYFIYTSDPYAIFQDSKYRKNYGYLSRIFYGQYVSGDKVIKASSGLQFQQTIGPCNQSQAINKWDGVACRDMKKYFAFNQKSSQIVMESYLRSTSQKYTFETWFKFQGYGQQDQDKASLMSVYDPYTPQNIQLQISIVKSDYADSFSIKCDPNANFDFKSILEPVYVKSLVKPNIWMHFTCKSNAYTKELNGILFDVESQITYYSVKYNSYTIQGIETILLKTIFGNDASGTSPFKGLMREVRFWNVERDDIEIMQFRYQSIPYNSDLKKSMIAYLMLNQGTGSQFIEFDYNQQVSSSHIYEKSIDNPQNQLSLVSSVSWINDRLINGSLPLRICPPGTVFSQNCCYKSDFTIKIDKKITIDDITSFPYIQLNLIITENFVKGQPISQNHYKHEFSIVNVSNFGGNATALADHLKLFQKEIDAHQDDPYRQLLFLQDHFSTNATYTFKAKVWSNIRNYDAVRETVIEVKPECPQVRISPKINQMTPIYISKMMDPTMLKFKLEIKDQCLDPQIQITEIDWTINSSPPSKYILSQDKKSLQFQEIQGKSIQIYAKVSYLEINGTQNFTQKTSDFITVQVLDEPFQLAINNIPEKIDAKKNDLVFDPKATDIKINFPILEEDRKMQYIVDCPPYLFTSEAHMKKVCNPDPKTGYLQIKADDTAYINYQEYNFTYTIRSDVLGYFESKTISIIFYSEQYFNCPKIFFSPRTDYSRRDQYFLIKPYIYLDCQWENNTPNTIIERFTVKNIQWQVEDFVNPKDFLDIYGLVAMVKKSKMDSMLTPNFAKNVTLTVTLNNGSVITTQTRFSVLRSQIQGDIQNSQNGTAVPFNETMVLDVSNFYDPDYPSDELSINWSMKDGQYTQINIKQLIITPFDRLTMNLLDAPQLIIVDVTNKQKGDQLTTKKSQWINFSHHKQSFKSSVASSNCQINLENTPDQYYFNQMNMSDFWISGSINQTSCFPSLLIQKSAFYIYIPYKLLSQNSTVQYQQTQQIKISQDDLDEMVAGETLNVDLIYLVSFMESLTSKTQYDYIVRTVKITRTQSPIEVLFKGIANKSVEIQVGQESSITFDASESYDIDRPTAVKNFTYIWICPAYMFCQSRSSHLTITRDMRVERNLNAIDSVIKVGLQVKSQNKESQISYLNLRVVKQDYFKCLIAKLEGAIEGVLQIYRDQYFPFKLNLKPDQVCANLSIKQVDWIPGQGNNTFWKSTTSMQSIRIESPSQLPQNIKKTSIKCQIQYEVYNFQNEIIKQQLSQDFTLQLNSPRMYISVRTNQKEQELFNLKDTNISQLILDASGSYDREDPTQKVSCQWTCPQQALCSPQQTSNCVLKVSDIKMINNQSKTEIAQFQLDVISQDKQKQETDIITITLVSSGISDKLPLCGIKQINDREIFEIDRQMIFIPDCFAAVKGQSFDQNYDFSWELSPQLTTVVKSNRKLVIPSLSLYSSLIYRQAGNLTISLKIQSKYDNSLNYKVSKTYEIPQFYEGVPNSQSISFDIQPSIVTTLFTRTTITVQDYELQNNEYFRLRAMKPLEESEILIDRSQNSTFQVYLPKDTIELFIDIIQDQRLNYGSYKIYSILVTGIMIQEPLSMTKQKFQFQILPRLQTVIDPQMDFTDIGEVKKQVQEIKTLKRIISSVKDTESQPRYNSLMFIRLQTLFNNTIIEEIQQLSASKDINTYLKSNFLDILANMFVESCANLDYKYQVQLYFEMMTEKLLSINFIEQLSENQVDLDFKLSYINALNLLYQSQCLNLTQRELIGNFSDKILLSSVVEGDSFYFGRGKDSDSKAIFYKISQLDREADNMLVFTSLDNNAIVTTRSIVLPQNSCYLSYRTLPNTQRPSTFKFGTQYLSSEVLVEMRIFDQNVTQVYPEINFQTQIEFVIQSAVVKQISQQNKTVGGMSICVSKNDNETSFLFSKVEMGLNTDDTQRLQGKVKCIAKHLSTFAVSYLLIDLQQPTKNLPALNSNNTLDEDDPLIFQSVPLLKYLLPALFVVIILVLAVLGLIMSQMEFNRPKRLYNKLSLTENLEKYSFFRLLACMVLQFNPIYNYVFKPNFYLTRPIRLLMFANYFLLVSSFCLLYYTWIPPGIRLADIFWFGFALMFIIGVARPKFQEYFFKLFYPKTLTNWKSKGNKYRGRMRSPRRNANRRNQRQQHTDMDVQVAQNLQEMINLGEEEETSPKKRSNANRRHRTTLFDEEEEDQRRQSKLENSQRLQESGARLVDESYNREEDEYEQRAATKGDEIVNFRDQKNRSRAAIMRTLSANQASSQLKNNKREEDSTVKKLFSKIIKNNNEKNNYNQEVEMTEIKSKNVEENMSYKNQIEESLDKDQYQKKDTTQQDSSQAENSTDNHTQSKKTSGLQYNSSFDRQSRDLLRHSMDSNQPALESEVPQNQEYAGFKFEKPEAQELPIHIELDSRNDISHADIDTSKDELNRDSSAGFHEDYIYQDKNKKRDNNENLHYEGGDEEVSLPQQNEGQQQDHRNTSQQEDYDENEEGASPEPLRAQSRSQEPQIPITIEIEEDGAKPQRPRRRRAQQSNQVEVGFNNQSRYTADEAHENNQRNPEGPENQGSGEQDESTPSLESVYKNYRELKEQDTSKFKRFVGILLLLFFCFGLLVLHVNCLSNMVESQFSNWISCTLFTFMVMIFVIDTALYALVAWGLKRTEGKVAGSIWNSKLSLQK